MVRGHPYAGVGGRARPDFWERNRSFKLNKESNKQLDAGVIYAVIICHTACPVLAAVTMTSSWSIANSTPQARNVDAARWGGEAELTWHFAPEWKIGQSLAPTRGKTPRITCRWRKPAAGVENLDWLR